MLKQKNYWARKALIILFWLIIWQILSTVIDNRIIFVGPVTMLDSLVHQMAENDFWKTIAYSFGKISAGFLGAFILGIFLGMLAVFLPIVQELLEPLMQLIKSVPVASFVVLALIWMGSGNLSIFISFLVVLPMIYISTIAGLKSTDKQLLEMAEVFQITKWKQFLYIYRPALLPYLVSSCRVALGMSWKSGIAAELIGVSEFSIGEKLYMSKIYLETGNLLAWTFMIILLSVAFEQLFLRLLKQLGR